MDRLSERIDHLRNLIQPAWTADRAEDVLEGIRQRQLQQRFRRQVFFGSTALAAAAIAALVWLDPASAPGAGSMAAGAPQLAESAHVVMASQRGEGQLTLADQSVVHTFAGSELSVLENQRKRVVLELPHGRAHFDVVPDKERLFSVQAGRVEVTVLGTIFDVSHVAGGVRVAVERGRVQVTADRQTHFVSAGEAAVFGADGMRRERPAVPIKTASEGLVVEPSETEPATESAKHEPPAASHSAPRKPSAVAWRSLAKAGDYEAAYRGLARERTNLSRRDPAALLDAADAARFSGHPEEAVGYLSRVTTTHRNSPMAPLAAFTLGRVCLDQLGQPHKAADAFALAYRLSPHGSLAQDAMARQIEALSKGGREAQAYELAERYVRKYPNGRRLRAVRLYGGLD